jgi:hypothetical protein
MNEYLTPGGTEGAGREALSVSAPAWSVTATRTNATISSWFE